MDRISFLLRRSMCKQKIYRRWIKISIFMCIFILTMGLSFSFFKDSRDIRDTVVPASAAKETGISIEVPLGASTHEIAKILEDNKLIKSTALFRILSKINGFDGMYRSGIHVITKNLKYEEMMKILSNEPESIKITIPEGYTFLQIAQLLYNKNLISDIDKFKNIAESTSFNYKFLRNINITSEFPLEGYLFPDTYKFGTKITEKDILNTMLENFDKKFIPRYYDRAKSGYMSIRGIITMASIIEREAKVPQDRKKIASVFYNRLNSKDMRKLQSCATVQYIYLKKYGKVKERLTEKDIKINDEYNTYIHDGLPPGPICSPSIQSIEAALYPEKTKYYYFVAKGDGSHEFSETLEDHNNAKIKYKVN